MTPVFDLFYQSLDVRTFYISNRMKLKFKLWSDTEVGSEFTSLSGSSLWVSQSCSTFRLNWPAIPKLYAPLVRGRMYGGDSYWSNKLCHSVKLLSPKKYSVSAGEREVERSTFIHVHTSVCCSHIAAINSFDFEWNLCCYSSIVLSTFWGTCTWVFSSSATLCFHSTTFWR